MVCKRSGAEGESDFATSSGQAADTSFELDRNGTLDPAVGAESHRPVVAKSGRLADSLQPTLLAAGLVYSVIQDAQAEVGNDELQDDGQINYKDLDHGSYVLVTKEAIPRIIPVDDPETSVTINRGSAGLSVATQSNSAGQLASLEAAYDAAYQTRALGQQDLGLQQDVQPQSGRGANGSSYVPIMYTTVFNDSLMPLSLSPSSNVIGGPSGSALPAVLGPTGNDLPFVLTLNVSVTGIAQAGQVLTALPVAGGTEPASLSYQWQSSIDGVHWSSLSGEIQPTYTIQPGDGGKIFRVEVTALGLTDGQTVVVDSAPMTATAPPHITVSIDGITDGHPREGDTLSANVSGAGTGDAVSYAWYSSKDGYQSVVATTKDYVVHEADEGYQLKLVATDVAGQNAGSATAETTTADVYDAAPHITVSIDGIFLGHPREGGTLSANVTGAESDDALSYAWYSSKDGYQAVVATTKDYVVQEGDEGYQLKLEVTDVADHNGGTAAAAATTAEVYDHQPHITVSIDGISGGNPRDGDTLSANVSGAESDDTLSYAWYSSRDGFRTPIATTKAYVVQETDEGYRLALVVTDTADHHGGISIAEASTGEIYDAVPHITASIDGITDGHPREGDTLCATVTGAESDDALSYAWYSSKDGYADPVATTKNYVVQEADEGYQLKLVVTDVADHNGGTATADATTAEVYDKAPHITVAISGLVNGHPQEGHELTAIVTGNEAGDQLSYQWVRSDGKVLGTDPTYTVRESDEGKTITLSVTATADHHGGSVTENATTPTVVDAPYLWASEAFLTRDFGLQAGHFVLVPFSGEVHLVLGAGDDDGGPVSLTVSGIPSDVELSNRWDHHLSVQNGSVMLSTLQLIDLRLEAGHTPELVTLNISATASDGGTTTATEPLYIEVSQHIAVWQGGSGDWSDAYQWTGGGQPGPGASHDALISSLGTYVVTVDTADASANSLTVDAGGATVLDGAGHALGLSQMLAVVGGTFDLEGGAVSAPSVLVDTAGMLFGHGVVDADVDVFGTVESNGGVLEIAGDVAGTGHLKIDSGSALQLDASDSAGVTFANNAGVSGTLVIEHADMFHGTVFGFSQNGSLHDQIDLADVDFDHLAPATYDAGTKTLAVSDGSHTANIKFDGAFSISSFQFASDGHGGTVVVDPPAAGAANAGFVQSVAFDQFGNEMFVFAPGFGNQTIDGFSNAGGSADKIQLDDFSGITSFAELQSLLHSANDGHDTLIDFGHGDSITLVNVQPTSLHASDFIFHHV